MLSRFVMLSGRFPDFFVIGAPKAGSTALWHALRRHPDIFLPALKEPTYFAYKGHALDFRCPWAAELPAKWVTDEETYKRLFADCPAGARAGEASVGYLASATAPAEMAAAVPDARLVAILRHPVERAFSSWLFARQNGRESITDFEVALAAAPARLATGWRPSYDYLDRGRYGTQLDRWLRFFDRSQLLILLHEDWQSQPQDVLQQICRHIGVEPGHVLLVTRENTTRSLRWPAAQQWLSSDTPARRLARSILPARVRDAVYRALLAANGCAKPTLDPRVRARLVEHYAAEVDRVEEITGRDLSAWRV